MPYKGKPNRRTSVITIDGPAGSGKSTVAKELAMRLGLLYIDTGAMYRALTLAALKQGANLSDEAALVKLIKTVDIQLRMQGERLRVLLDAEDVTAAIRKQSLTEQVRFVAQFPGVRKEMVKLQRSLAEKSAGAVLEGRDIGTVVFPESRHKFFLDANENERIKRRFNELQQMGEHLSLKQIARDVNRRDKSDRTRKVAPLVKAEDALYIDTTDLSVKEVAEKIIGNVLSDFAPDSPGSV